MFGYFWRKLIVHSTAALSGSIIVKVGSEGKEYTLHKSLLAHHSGYFRGSLSGNFKETDDGVIPLDDVDTDAFEVFVDWMYKDRLPQCVHRIFRVNGFDAGNEAQISIRYRAYVLADRLIIPGLKKALLKVTFDRYSVGGRPGLWLVVYFFNNLPEEDPMLRLLVDGHCINNGVNVAREGVSIARLEQLPANFLVRVMHKLEDLTHIDKADWVLRLENYEQKTA